MICCFPSDNLLERAVAGFPTNERRNGRLPPAGGECVEKFEDRTPWWGCRHGSSGSGSELGHCSCVACGTIWVSINDHTDIYSQHFMDTINWLVHKYPSNLEFCLCIFHITIRIYNLWHYEINPPDFSASRTNLKFLFPLCCYNVGRDF